MTGLKIQLQNLIEKYHFMSYDEIKRFCESGQSGKFYRMSTAERRLRPSESPMIEAVYSDRGFVKGYKFRKKEQQLNLI